MNYMFLDGYGPAVASGNVDCDLREEDFLYLGRFEQWMKPNQFGGVCGYLIIFGVDYKYDSSGKVTIQRQHEYTSLGSAALLVSIASAAGLVSLL